MQVPGVSSWAAGLPGGGAASAVGADLNDLRAALRGQGDGTPLQPVASLLGISVAQIQTDLKNGQTLAQIASAQGKSASDVDDALMADVQSRLSTAVQSGQLTQTQAQGILDASRQRVDNLVTGQHRSYANQANSALISLGGPTLLDLLYGNQQPTGTPAVDPTTGTSDIASMLGSLTDLNV